MIYQKHNIFNKKEFEKYCVKLAQKNVKISQIL